PPFGHPRIQALSAAPRGLSRPDTSFIGSWYQGIHRAPLHTYTQMNSSRYSTLQSSNLKNRCSHPLSSSQTPHRTPDHTATTRPHTTCRRYSTRSEPGPKKTPSRAAPSGPNSVPPDQPRRPGPRIVDVSTHERRHRTLAEIG